MFRLRNFLILLHIGAVGSSFLASFHRLIALFRTSITCQTRPTHFYIPGRPSPSWDLLLNPMPLAILTKTYSTSRIEHMSYKWIRTSEISEYVYCRRAWWLKQTHGLQSGHTRQLQAGQRHHQQHGKRVRQVSWMRGLAYAMLFCVVAYVVFQLLIGG
ncbi:MAG: hypothetical protein JSV68_03105, partial [Anaerolineaceae bacterium]